jgi:NADH dehydrogenase FAD-containing subunit
VNFSKKRLFVEESAIQSHDSLALTADDSAGKGENVMKKGKIFEIGYDKLVVAVGCYSQTFGTKGVKDNALFLKDVGDARKIRKRILDCKSAGSLKLTCQLTCRGFETASLPSTSDTLRKQLLNFAVVGGGRGLIFSTPS